MDGRRKSKPNNRDLKQLRRRRQWKHNQKNEFASFQTLSRLFGTALFVKVGLFSWSWILKGYIHVQVLHKTSNGKVSRRSRAVDVKEMYLKAWCTCRAVDLLIKPTVFRRCYRRRRSCLRSLISTTIEDNNNNNNYNYSNNNNNDDNITLNDF